MAQHFEVAVLGGTPAAALMAALIARNNHRVVWIDHGELCATYQDQGFVLPRKPGLALPLGDAPHPRRLHERLGLTLSMRPQVPTVPLGMIAGRRRWALGGAPQQIHDELAAEFGDGATAMHMSLDALLAAQRNHDRLLGEWPVQPVEPMWARLRHRIGRSAHAAQLQPVPIGTAPASFDLGPEHPLTRLLAGAMPLVSHSSGALPRLAWERLAARLMSGGSLPHGGPAHGSEALVEAAERAGAEVRRDTLLSGIGGDRRRLGQLFFAGERQPLGADYIVDATTLGLHAAELLRGTAATVPAPPLPQGQLEVLNVVVKARVLPEPLGAQTLLLGRPGEPVLLLVRSAVQQGRFEVLSIVFAAVPRLSDETRSITAATLMRRVGQVVPYLERGVETLSWPEVAAGRTGVVHHPLYACPGDAIGGRSRRTPWKNTVRLGPDVLPTLDLEGSYMAAQGGLELLGSLAGWSA